jgi:FkbM family methyltransferase
VFQAAKNMVRSTLVKTGYDLVPISQQPGRTFLGQTKLPIRTVIDVGANEGQFARLVTDFFGSAMIHSFEPLPGPRAILQSWANTQNGRVTVHGCALGDQPGTAQMLSHVDFSPSSSLLPSTRLNEEAFPQTRRHEEVSVEIATLDAVFPESGKTLDKDILLKLDVQGFEDRVLSGAKQLLTACRLVLVEVNIDPLYEGQADFFSICDPLREAGFAYRGNLGQYHAPDGHAMFADVVFERPGKSA